LGLVPEGSELRPARCGISEAQGEGIFTVGEAAVMGNGIDFAKSGLFILPLLEGSD
jgi:hypothetical protein